MNFFYKYKVQLIVFLLIIILGMLSAFLVKNRFFETNINKDIGKVIFDNPPLPEVKLLGVQNKKDFSEELKTGKVLLFYLVTNCQGCKTETDIINKSGLIQSSDLKVIAISYESEESINEFVNENDVKFPILMDDNGKFREKLDIEFFPTNYVIKNGIIEKSWLGTPLNVSDFKKKLNSVPTK